MTRPPASPAAGIDLRRQLLFIGAAALAFLLLFTLLRLALLVYNRELVSALPLAALGEPFWNGLRFDLRLTVYICLPLLFTLLSPRAMATRRLQRIWLGAWASLTLLLGIVELDFYREFHQRLNKLVFQYFKEDPGTVASMLWHGFPVGRYLLIWALGSAAFVWLLGRLDAWTRPAGAGAEKTPGQTPAIGERLWRWGVFFLCLSVSVVAARGTLRQGPPLRWGDAFTTESMFLNHLGLNGALTLADAARNELAGQRKFSWKNVQSPETATRIVRDLLLTPYDTLVDADRAPVRRLYTPPKAGALPIRNVVVILMESMAARYVGALGAPGDITPNFDRLAREGLLFTHVFSNGTHTHQGMFATMGCFPNLPGFEYLMQTPEGGHHFSGLPQLLGPRGYDDYYIYNGDFAWDNQEGFFRNQGMTTFIGRHAFVDPVFSDPTWGVSDQDMFDRAIVELKKRKGDKPFYALLQTLSNHTPYALPDKLPVEPVTGHGDYNQHLTAMRYADWALGRFFEQARQLPSYKETLFVIVGDHGFGGVEQLTDIDLLRFHVPLLLIAPGVQARFGHTRDTVATQVDIVPTILGRLGEKSVHQCWGRDLLALPAGDPGFGVIKPSGSSQDVAILRGRQILVMSEDGRAKLYDYEVGARRQAVERDDPELAGTLREHLQAYIQTATQSLLADTVGAYDAKAASGKP